jgi:hypothetical protein
VTTEDAGAKANRKAAEKSAGIRRRLAKVMKEYPERDAELNQPKQKRQR